MPCCRSALGVALCLCVWASSASAIIIETADGKKHVGRLLDDDGKKLTLREQLSDGEEAERIYPNAKIKDVPSRLDEKLLKALSKDNPKAYSDYADELAKREGDPETKEVARRLYLIAASLDPRKFGTTSLVKLSKLADTQAEARRCLALAYRLDPKAEAKLLERPAARPEKADRLPAEALKQFLEALRAYRAGNVNDASRTAERKGMDKIFHLAPGDLDQAAFVRMCRDRICTACKGSKSLKCTNCMGKGLVRNSFGLWEVCTTCNKKKWFMCDTCAGRGVHQDLSSDTLRVLLRAELWATEQLLGREPGGEKKPGPGEALKWSSVLQKQQTSPMLPLSLDTITEFNPRESKYREYNTWVVPSD